MTPGTLHAFTKHVPSEWGLHSPGPPLAHPSGSQFSLLPISIHPCIPPGGRNGSQGPLGDLPPPHPWAKAQWSLGCPREALLLDRFRNTLPPGPSAPHGYIHRNTCAFPAWQAALNRRLCNHSQDRPRIFLVNEHCLNFLYSRF